MHESEAVPASQTITEEDLEELETITTMVLHAAESKKTDSLFALYQRLKHVIVRTRKLFEE